MRLAAYLLAPLLGAAVPALAQVQPVPGTPAVRSDADALADVVRRVGRSPRDLNALIEAGDLSFRVGDVTAAAAFYKRAEAIDPDNGRVKAGVARILVNGEHPGEALRFFALAERQGAPMADYAGDRGFAYDLIGEQERAQRDYRLALSRGEDEEVRRRYALSLGISGRREEALAQIDTLLRQSDRGAWRARAFILAMGGDTAGASRIATSMMPRGMAGGLDAFFRRLPTLSPADRAFAVHFGEVVATPERVADARLVPPLPALGADPYAPRSAAPVQTAAAAPVEDRRTRRAREREARRTALAANDRPSAATAPWGVARAASSPRPALAVPAATVPVPAATVPPQVAAASTLPPTTAASRSLAAAVLAARGPATVPPVVAPVRSTVPAANPPVPAAPAVGLAGVPAAAAPAAGVVTPPIAPATLAPGVASPAAPQVVSASPAPSPAPPVTPMAGAKEPAARATAPRVANEAPAPPVDVPASASGPAARAPAAQVAAASLPSPTGTGSAAPTPEQAAPVAEVAVAPAPQVAAATPVPPRMSEDSILARIVAGLSVPASELGVAPMPGAAPPPVAATSTTVPLEQAAAKAERNVVADEEKRERLTAVRVAERAALAQDIDKRPAKTEPKRVAKVDPKKAEPKADGKKADAKKVAADGKADAKKKTPAEPARIWVQVAGGANEGDLPRAWKDVQAKTPALAGRAAYSTPLRATNRVVTGPFKTEAEARAMVNKLSKQGLSAFTFTSEAGQKMTKLGGK
jgi:tetratricopeptide (TPR) repeat protein